MNRQYRSLSLWLFVAVVAASVAWWLWPASRTTKAATPTNEVLAATPRAMDVRSRWKALAKADLALSSTEAIAQQLRQTLSVIPGDASMTESQRAALASSLALQLEARAAATPEAYVRLASRDAAYRWIDEADRGWNVIDTWWSFRFNSVPARDQPDTLLVQFLNDQMTNQFARLTSAALDSSGTRVFTFNIRAPQQIGIYLDDHLGTQDTEYWLHNPGHNAIGFRVPKRSLSTIIDENTQAQVAVVMMIVTMASGESYNWYSVWFWDPQLQSWTCHQMARKGWHGLMYF